MAASPGVPTPTSQNLQISTALGPLPKMEVCRLCAKEGQNFVEIFSQAGKSLGLPEKVKDCLPILVSSAIFSSLYCNALFVFV